MINKRLSPRPRWKRLYLAALMIGYLALPACQPTQTGATPSAVPPYPTLPTVIRLTSGDWKPYTGEDLVHFGCDAWIVNEAFSEVGITVKFEFFPWARAYQEAAEGAFDGTLDWADTPEHQQSFYLSAEPLSDQEWSFFYRADEPFDWQTLDDLEGKTVGLTSGYVYGNFFKEAQSADRIKFEVASSDIANFQKLLNGRIDVFPIERKVGKYILEENFSAQDRARLVDHPKPFDQFRPYLLLSKAVPNNQPRIFLFDTGFQRIKENGVYDNIMQNCLESSPLPQTATPPP